MATISSRNATAIGGAGAARSEEGLWSYAVPAADEPSTADASQVQLPRYANGNDEQAPPVQQMNAATAPLNRTQSSDRARSIKSTHTTEHSRLSSGRSKTLARKVSDITGSHSSKAESLLELYTQPAENIRSSPWPAAQPDAGTGGAIGFDKTLEDKWIHRDKLAQIENREMRQAGIKLGLRSASSRLTSQAPSAAGEVVQEHEEEDAEAMADAQSAGVETQNQLAKRQRTLSPSRSFAEDIIEDVEPSRDVDAESQRSASKRGTSRIPVSRGTSGPNSPDPDSPGGRSRTNSNPRGHTRNASSGNAIAYPGPDGQPVTAPTQGRRVGVPIPVNTAGIVATDPSNTSPTKAKTPAKKGTSTSAKSTPASKSPSTSKATNSPNAARRPSESEGNSRPSTAVAEVEPPWISSMFKPDPRLPPDQQMLPTHAKKLAQEQGYTFNDPGTGQANVSGQSQAYGANGQPVSVPGVPAPPYSQTPDQQQAARGPTQYAPPHLPAANGQKPAEPAFVANPTTPLAQQQNPPNPTQASSQTNPQVQTTQQFQPQQQQQQQQQQQPVPQPQIWTPPQDQNGNPQPVTQGDSQDPKAHITPSNGEPGADAPSGPASPDRRRRGKQSAQDQEEKGLPRIPDAEDDEKTVKKKGCGCCVVM